MLRRLFLCICVVSVGLVLVAPAVGSLDSTPAALDRLLDGPFHGSGTIEFGSPGCNGIHSVQNYVYGEGRTPQASGTVHAEGCADTSTFPFSVRSTFVITSRTGATLTGTIVGASTTSDFTNTYTVTGGTGRFTKVTGTVHATATFVLTGNSLQPIEGTYDAALRQASA